MLKKTLECRNMYCKLKYVVIYLKIRVNNNKLNNICHLDSNYIYDILHIWVISVASSLCRCCAEVLQRVNMIFNPGML